MGMGNQLSRRQRPPGEIRRNLKRHDSGGRGGIRERTRDAGHDLGERGAHRGLGGVLRERRAQVAHDVVLARSQKRPVAAVESLDEVQRCSNGRLVMAFDFEIETRIGESFEAGFERGNPVAVSSKGVMPARILESKAGIEHAQIVPYEIRGQAVSLRHPVDTRIVQQDRDAIARDVDITLDDLRSLLESAREGGECVFRMAARGAAMADHDGTQYIEKRVRHGIRLSCAAMAVLTRDVILRELEEGRVQIDPFEISQVGVASIDLTLGSEIREIVNADSAIPVVESTDYRDHTRVLELDRPYRLDPGVTIHGITAEHLTLPDDLCGFLEGRSRFARLGLMIHVTSALVQPGVSNRQVLEMSNVSSRALDIVPGVRICQLVLMRTEGHAIYRGRFQDQREI